MAFRRDSCYFLTHLHPLATARPSDWIAVSPSSNVTLQIGSTVGLLCDHDGFHDGQRFHVRHYFFTLDQADVTLHRYLQLRFEGDRPVVALPRMETVSSDQATSFWGHMHGRFEHAPHLGGFDDAYLCRAAAVLESDPAKAPVEELVLRSFFRQLGHRMALRRGFRKLYFRCFRRCFAPDNSQGRKSIREGWEELTSWRSFPCV